MPNSVLAHSACIPTHRFAVPPPRSGEGWRPACPELQNEPVQTRTRAWAGCTRSYRKDRGKSSKLVKGAQLLIYAGGARGIRTTGIDRVDADLPAFISKAKAGLKGRLCLIDRRVEVGGPVLAPPTPARRREPFHLTD